MERDLFDDLNEHDEYLEEAPIVTEEEIHEEEPEVQDEPEIQEGEAEESEVAEPVQKAEGKKDNLVPLAALMEERVRAKANRDEAEVLRQRIAAMEKAQSSKTVPDPLESPSDFYNHMRENMMVEFKNQQILENFHRCRERALTEHGSEYLDQLSEWTTSQMLTDHSLEQRALNAVDPVQYVIDLKKRHDLRSQFETDPDEYVRIRAAEMGLLSTGANVETQQAAKKPTGPKSLANSQSRVGSKPKGTGMDSFFS
jgi:hypothetical protein